jgi:hypothetical protein
VLLKGGSVGAMLGGSESGFGDGVGGFDWEGWFD